MQQRKKMRTKNDEIIKWVAIATPAITKTTIVRAISVQKKFDEQNWFADVTEYYVSVSVCVYYARRMQHVNCVLQCNFNVFLLFVVYYSFHSHNSRQTTHTCNIQEYRMALCIRTHWIMNATFSHKIVE